MRALHRDYVEGAWRSWATAARMAVRARALYDDLFELRTRAGEQTYAALRRACQEFLKYDPPLAGVIRRDDHVRDSIRHQTPLLTRHPGSDAARDVERIAAHVLREI